MQCAQPEGNVASRKIIKLTVLLQCLELSIHIIIAMPRHVHLCVYEHDKDT